MRQRLEELRRNREQRALILKRRRNRRIRQAFLCILLLGITVFFAVFFFTFPARFKQAQQEKQQEELKGQDIITVANIDIEEKKVSESAQEPSEEPTEEPQKAESAFSSMPGYLAENEERYQTYKATTGYSDSEVIWRVNARLDLTEYQDYITLDTERVNQNPLVIVNKYHRVPDGYEPPDLKANSDGCYLRAEAADAFDRMKRDAASQGLTLRAVSGYRSVEYQRNLYNGYLSGDSQANVDTYSARAGHSEHHTGLAVDVFGSVDGLDAFVNTPEYQWVRQHGADYGFIIRYTSQWEEVTGYMDEPWHLRYIGEQYAQDMQEKGIATLEEYVGRNGLLK